ncbi:unnamed protein product [Clonostachys solani]|uniref:Uncharacterized protein n=1 Tax=Clonostachys solani TaxID=160281 RepID=A0A9N9W5Y7_9HYPO|nr:unnamed protein product [Clonostachys solani]
MRGLKLHKDGSEEPSGSKKGCLWGSSPWAFEIIGLVLAAAQFFAMFGVLVHFDGKEPNTSSIITPNTIVSILSTGSKAALLSAAAGCIGQANWVLFAGQPRRLYDFELVSDASRGPLGSIQLLLSRKFRGGVLVRLGAVITILTIAMDPFAQQLVQLQNLQVSEPGGRISQAVRYSLVNPAGRIDTATPANADADFTMKAAVMFGTTASSQSIVQQATLSCPGELCEFSSVASLAVCSRCNDIDSSLEQTDDGDGMLWYELTNGIDGIERGVNCTRYSLPNGLYLDNIDNRHGTGDRMVYMTTWGTANRTKTISMEELDTLIWSQSMIKVSNDTTASENIVWPNFKVHATECALYYCVKEYDFTVQNSTKKEVSSKILTEVRRNYESWLPQRQFANERLSADVIESIAFNKNDSLVSRSDLQLQSDGDGSKKTWNISDEAVKGISYFAQTLFSTCILGNCSDVPDEWQAPTGFYQSHQQIGHEHRPGPAKPLWESTDLSATFSNIAMSMSNALRDSDDTGQSQEGMVTRGITTYRIEWPWIALHGFLAMAMAVFFFLSLTSRAPDGARVPVWKTSNLAVLSRGYLVPDIMRDEQTSEQLERTAKATQARLIFTDHQNPMHHVQAGSESPEEVEMVPVPNVGKASRARDRSGPV